jgi:disulfide bond formation protein DsbB
MAWGALIVCGLVLWAACGGVYAMGREVWPGEMPEIVRLSVAPAIAAAATLAHKIAAPDFSALTRAAAFALIVAALDALVLGPAVDHSRKMFRSALGAWLPLAAIFVASYLTGAYGPM